MVWIDDDGDEESDYTEKVTVMFLFFFIFCTLKRAQEYVVGDYYDGDGGDDGSDGDCQHDDGGDGDGDKDDGLSRICLDVSLQRIVFRQPSALEGD